MYFDCQNFVLVLLAPTGSGSLSLSAREGGHDYDCDPEADSDP
jgi:hypothetical protein